MDVAVIVNLRARRGSEAVGRMVRDLLPRARVTVTRSLDEVRSFISRELAPNPPALLLSGGGDGTAVALVNELRTMEVDYPLIGVLPLGTGNGWAHVTGAPRTREALQRIAALHGRTPPARRFGLVESEGQVAPFLGTGWDAEIISDFKAQLKGLPPGIKSFNDGLRGYLRGMFTRTIPRHMFGSGAANVTLINTGDPATTIDENKRVVPLPGGETGKILYRGPASVAASSTTPEWGFGFRAFPFADEAQLQGRVSTRVYSAPVLEATRNMFKLWRGEHPMPKMHDFFLTSGRMEFDREVPFQIGGDLAGMRRAFDFRIAGEGVDLVDWRKLRAA